VKVANDGVVKQTRKASSRPARVEGRLQGGIGGCSLAGGPPMLLGLAGLSKSVNSATHKSGSTPPSVVSGFAVLRSAECAI
jgi:hypothetical protein